MGKGDIHMTGFWKRLWRRNSTESSDENATTCFGPGVEIEGKINVSAGTIRVNTRVKGEISSNGSIEVGPRGELEATVRAKAVIVAGKVNGDIQVSDCLEIKQHGIVLGDVDARVLIVEPGGYFDGQCKMPVAEVESQPRMEL